MACVIPHLVIPGLLYWVFSIFYGNPVYAKSGGIFEGTGLLMLSSREDLMLISNRYQRVLPAWTCVI